MPVEKPLVSAYGLFFLKMIPCVLLVSPTFYAYILICETVTQKFDLSWATLHIHGQF